MADTVVRLAYDEAVRTLKAQEDVLDNLRTRAGTLIAVASLVTSFLGGQALAKPTLSGGEVVRSEIGDLGYVAIGLFVLVASLALAILWPWTWRFDTKATVILDEWPRDEYEEAIEELARVHEENRARNKAILNRLFICFQVACAFLVAETIAWILDLSEVSIK